VSCGSGERLIRFFIFFSSQIILSPKKPKRFKEKIDLVLEDGLHMFSIEEKKL